jgi:hypothetical protein
VNRRNVLPVRNRIGEMLDDSIVGEPANRQDHYMPLRISTRTCLSWTKGNELVYLHDAGF